MAGIPRNATGPLDQLTRRVSSYFRARAARYGLDAQALEVRYILNWGGFVNASFALTDGRVSYHLKLADDEEMQERLARWKAVGPLLSERYRAPRILDWVAIPRTAYAGLLCEHLPGQPANLAGQPRVLQEVLDLLARLHADRDLSAALAALGDEVTTCAEAFLSLYIDRLDEDLLTIARDLPPFVPLSLLDWMMGETRELEGLARDLPAFQQPAAAPTHADLWPSNILVADEAHWAIIDWDDLSLGDPALDYSILLGPLWQSGHATAGELEQRLPADPAFRERFRLCLRALLLDQVIDPLADWIESDFAPEHQSEVRPAKEATHREALALYRQLYQE